MEAITSTTAMARATFCSSGAASLTAARISARMPRPMRSTSSRAPSIRLVLLQLHRDVAGVVLERLAVLVAFWDRARLLASDLDKVAFAVPVTYLQGLQAGREPLFGLEARQPLVGAVAELARLVELPRVAGAYDLTAFLGDRRGDQLPHSRRLLHGPKHAREQ